MATGTSAPSPILFSGEPCLRPERAVVMRSRIKLLLGSLLLAGIRAPVCAASPAPSASLFPNLRPIWRQAPSTSTSQQTRLHQQKADAYLRDKRPDLAIPELAAVVAAEPNNIDAQANLGVLLFFAGKPQEAEPHLRAALTIDPSLAKVRMLLGTCEHRAGHLEDARKDISAALPQITDPKGSPTGRPRNHRDRHCAQRSPRRCDLRRPTEEGVSNRPGGALRSVARVFGPRRRGRPRPVLRSSAIRTDASGDGSRSDP